MKGVVVRDVGHFAFRPRIGLRAQYTAVTFLSQITLSHKARPRVVGLCCSLGVTSWSPRCTPDARFAAPGLELA